jgi:hypothetical protein
MMLKYFVMRKANQIEQKLMNQLFLLVVAWALSDLGGQETIYLESIPNGTSTLAYQITVNLMVTGWVLGVGSLLMILRICEKDLINRHKHMEDKDSLEVNETMNIWKLFKDKRAVSPAAIVIFVVAIFVTGVLLPTAMNGFQAANYSNVDATVKIVCYLLLPIVAVVGLALMFLKNVK